MYPHHVFDLEPAGTFGIYPICYQQVSGRYFQPEPAMYSRCFHWFPGPLAPSVSSWGVCGLQGASGMTLPALLFFLGYNGGLWELYRSKCRYSLLYEIWSHSMNTSQHCPMSSHNSTNDSPVGVATPVKYLWLHEPMRRKEEDGNLCMSIDLPIVLRGQTTKQ